jgi:hypothetical protein
MTESTITSLLPRYYEVHKTDLQYEPVRTINIDGHEVAWMHYTGTIVYDITSSGREGESFEGHELKCECDFTEGVGWKVEERNGNQQVLGLDAGRKCLNKEAAKYLRQLELRREYEEQFSNEWGTLTSRLPEIFSDLARKVEAGEFIGESTGGARFYGGWFYLQTVAAITDIPIGMMWDTAYELVAEKKIGLDGAVVLPYREPPPPQWVENFREEHEDGWITVASLPGHRSMPQAWKLEVLKPDGAPAYSFVPPLALVHESMFGPDVEDVQRAKERLTELLALAKKGGED